MFQVTWKFDLSWNWNDLDRINWIAQAVDSEGASIWPANSASGTGNAVENDLQIDSFEIRRPVWSSDFESILNILSIPNFGR